MLATGALAMSSPSGASTGASEWTTLYPVGQPVSLSLPSSWQNTQPPQGESFYSFSPDSYANVQLTVSTYAGAAASFSSDLYKRARQVYLAQDPKATIRSRTVALPAGHAFEVITRVVRRVGSRSYPLSVQSYAFLHRGKVFEFVYLTYTPRVGVYFPLFDRSARSIRFRSSD